MVLKGKSHQVQ